jgi:hypothetical protein
VTATDHGYRQADSLPVGAEIYIFGNRKVLDVHNTSRPDYVRLVTNDGTFEVRRDLWIAPAGDYPLGDD